MARDALHMRKTWTAVPSASVIPAPVHVRSLSKADEATLGQLMWVAFHGSADDDWYATPEDAAADTGKALDGHWGPVVWEASLAAELGSALVSAVVVVRDNKHAYLPLLAFAMTDPAYQGRGIGRLLIEESVHRLDVAGVKELHLAVTRGNPAAALYQRLGFAVVP
jgi:ribosomal protein S18 acetylase RimI-like enzyme